MQKRALMTLEEEDFPLWRSSLNLVRDLSPLNSVSLISSVSLHKSIILTSKKHKSTQKWFKNRDCTWNSVTADSFAWLNSFNSHPISIFSQQFLAGSF